MQFVVVRMIRPQMISKFVWLIPHSQPPVVDGAAGIISSTEVPPLIWNEPRIQMGYDKSINLLLSAALTSSPLLYGKTMLPIFRRTNKKMTWGEGS